MKHLPDSTDSTIEQWLTDYHDLIYHEIANRLKRGLVGGWDKEAEDLTQVVFVRAQKSLKGGNMPVTSAKNWLKKIAENECIKFFKKNTTKVAKLAVSLQQPILSDVEELTLEDMLEDDEANGPEQMTEQHERMQMLQKALAELPPEQQIAVQRHDLDGWTFKQISERHYEKRAPSTVGKDRNKGIEQLRVRLTYVQE